MPARLSGPYRARVSLPFAWILLNSREITVNSFHSKNEIPYLIPHRKSEKRRENVRVYIIPVPVCPLKFVRAAYTSDCESGDRQPYIYSRAYRWTFLSNPRYLRLRVTGDLGDVIRSSLQRWSSEAAIAIEALCPFGRVESQRYFVSVHVYQSVIQRNAAPELAGLYKNITFDDISGAPSRIRNAAPGHSKKFVVKSVTFLYLYAALHPSVTLPSYSDLLRRRPSDHRRLCEVAEASLPAQSSGMLAAFASIPRYIDICIFLLAAMLCRSWRDSFDSHTCVYICTLKYQPLMSHVSTSLIFQTVHVVRGRESGKKLCDPHRAYRCGPTSRSSFRVVRKIAWVSRGMKLWKNTKLTHGTCKDISWRCSLSLWISRFAWTERKYRRFFFCIFLQNRNLDHNAIAKSVVIFGTYRVARLWYTIIVMYAYGRDWKRRSSHSVRIDLPSSFHVARIGRFPGFSLTIHFLAT